MGIWDYIKESVSIGISEFTRVLEKELGKTIEIKINHLINNIKRQFMKELLSIFTIIISIGLLSISAVYFLIEYLSFTKTLSFLIIGIIVLLIGIIIKLIK